MPVLVGSLGDLGLNCLIFAGRVSRSEALGFPARISPERPEFGVRWLTIFDSAADMSDLDADSLLTIKERLRPVVAGLLVKGQFRMILVSNSRFNDHLMECWRAMTVTDPSYPSNPETAASVPEACIRHGLPRDRATAAEVWIEQQIRSASAA